MESACKKRSQSDGFLQMQNLTESKLESSAAHKIGLVSVSFRKHSAATLIEASVGAGIDGIEWGGDVHVPHGDLKTARAVAEQTRDAGLAISCYGSYYKFGDVTGNPDGPEFAAVLDCAAELGAPSIRVWAGTLSSAKADDKYFAAIVDQAHIIAERASELNIRVDFECHNNTLNDGPAASEKLLSAIEHPNLCSLWQPLYPHPMEHRIDGIRRMLSRLTNVHVYHWNPEDYTDRKRLSEGATEWRAYLEALHADPRPRWYSLEFFKDDSLDVFRGDAETLRSWL